jgi:integration host factor subunit beta
MQWPRAGRRQPPNRVLQPKRGRVVFERDFDEPERTAMTDATITKADLVEEVVRVTELPRKESETVVETIFDNIIHALQSGDKIEIRGFGSFRTRQRRGRTGRNPKTGEKVDVPAKKIPFFKPSKELKDFVNTHASAAGSAKTA